MGLMVSRIERAAVRICLFLLPALVAVSASLLLSSVVSAQIEPPDRQKLFAEDRNRNELQRRQKEELRERKKIAESRAAAGGTLPFDIDAQSLNFNATTDMLEAVGDVIITYSTLVAEAERAEVDVKNNKARLVNNVRISDLTADINAELAEVDLKTGAGRLVACDLLLAEGDYRLAASEVIREEGDRFSLKDALFTTCGCPAANTTLPWSIAAKETTITREGYGFSWHNTLRVKDVPVLYLPFLAFPAKNERQTGLLSPVIGQGRQSGFELQIPFYWAISESSDATLIGVYESEIRTGADLEARTVFSRSSAADVGFVYLNESARDGRLFGTDITGLTDPSIDENRFGGYLDHRWSGEVFGNTTQLILDGAYASDDLLIREYPKERIARFNSRFITSTAVLRTSLGTNFTADASAEYNQGIVDDDDLIFQRLPELNLSGIHSFKVFGENPYGAKLLLNSNLSHVTFAREENYDGSRSELYERATVPFHYQNIFDGSLTASARGSLYNLDETEILGATESDSLTEFDSSSNRVVPSLGLNLGTVLEKVYPVGENNLIKRIAELGRRGRSEELLRVKHTFEPTLKYLYVPDVDQSDTPLFDSLDRLADRNVVTYGLTQRLLGRHEPRDQYLYGIEEAAPRVEDLGSLRSSAPLDRDLTFGFDDPTPVSDFRTLRRGSISELARFSVSQSYNIFDLEEERNGRFREDSFSDVHFDALLFPNEYIALHARSDYDPENQGFSAYSIDGKLSSKRGDSIISRLRFVDRSVRQLETGAEARVTDFLKVGYYSRYDDLSSDFIEQRGAVRFSSSCRCWLFDLQVSDRTNPNETQFAFNVTLLGLGEIGNTFFSRLNDQ